MFIKSVIVGVLSLVLGGCVGAHAQPQQQAVAQPAPDEGPFMVAQARQSHVRRIPPRIQRFDTNHDGVLQASEVPPRLRQWFMNVDTNKDGIVTAQEIHAWNRQHRHPRHQSPQQPQRSASTDVHPSELTL